MIVHSQCRQLCITFRASVGAVHQNGSDRIRHPCTEGKTGGILPGCTAQISGDRDENLMLSRTVEGDRQGERYRVLPKLGLFRQRLLPDTVQKNIHTFHCQYRFFPVKKFQFQFHRLTLDGQLRFGNQRADACVFFFLHPDGRSDGNVSVGLGYLYIIVGLVRGQRKCCCGPLIFAGLLCQRSAFFADDLHSADGIRGVREGDKNIGGLAQLPGFQTGTHPVTVYGIGNGQIRILGGIDPAAADGIEKAFLCQGLGIDHRAATGIVVHRGHMPAFFQSPVIKTVSRRRIGTAYFQQGHHLICFRCPKIKIPEIAVPAAGMVELADGIRMGGKCGIKVL